MEIKESTQHTSISEERAQFFKLGWWIRQIKRSLDIRRPRGVITIILAFISLPCGVVGYNVCCPFSVLLLGPLAAFLSVRQEKDEIFSREQGAIVGSISAIVIVLIQTIVLTTYLILSLNNLSPSILNSSNYPEIDPSNLSFTLFNWHVLITVFNLLITGIIAYLTGYVSVTLEKSGKQFDVSKSLAKTTSRKDELIFSQIEQILNVQLREKIKRATSFLNIDNVDVGLFLLSKEFESTLLTYLVQAERCGKITNPTPGKWKSLDEMINSISKEGIITDKAILHYLRQKRNDRAHGTMPSLNERQLMMNNLQSFAGLYIDYIKLFDEMTSTLTKQDSA